VRNRTATRYLIYRATSPSGKVYVGLTCNSLRRRIQHHMGEARRGGRFVFHAALRKYGSAMVWDVLEEVGSYEEACAREHHWVVLLEAHVPGKGYNGTLGGDGGQRPSEATRAKLSMAARGRPQSEESRRRRSETMKGRVHTREALAKISAANRGKKRSAETRRKLSEAHVGKRLSEETLQKLRDREFSKEHRSKLSAAGRGRPKSSEHREAISRARRTGVLRDDGVSFESVRCVATELGISSEAVYAAMKRDRLLRGHRYRYESSADACDDVKSRVASP
jgi:group I intron endonuclease